MSGGLESHHAGGNRETVSPVVVPPNHALLSGHQLGVWDIAYIPASVSLFHGQEATARSINKCTDDQSQTQERQRQIEQKRVRRLGSSHLERRPLHSQDLEVGQCRDPLWDRAIEASAGRYPERSAHRRHVVIMGWQDPSLSHWEP